MLYEAGKYEYQDKHRLLKQGIWLYFFLLIFEGALRKWILPELAIPLLIIRDPLSICLILIAKKKKLFQINVYVFTAMLIGLISIYTALLAGHGNIYVALYGARIFLFQFPLIFVIGRVFKREDVLKMGEIIIWLSIPMTILISLQFYSPQSAWVNRGLGGDIEGAGFGGALGYYRPPGTFSFTNGVHFFYGLAACFIFYFWLQPNSINRLVLLVATGSLLSAIPLSISRSLFFLVAFALLFAIIAIIHKPKNIGRMVLIAFAVCLSFALLSKTAFFQTAIEAFFARFENATDSEGGLSGTFGDRYLGGMLSAISGSTVLPFWGYGIGMGTNVGSMLLSGDRTFLIAEEEWARLIGELGVLMGIGIIYLRLRLSLKIALASYRKLKKGDFLPWILLSFCILTIPQSQWAQPTTLGFSILIGGLILASLKQPHEMENDVRLNF